MVKVVTDSSADIPPELVAELGITVVPLHIRFGDETYRDGIDITPDEFYTLSPRYSGALNAAALAKNMPM